MIISSLVSNIDLSHGPVATLTMAPATDSTFTGASSATPSMSGNASDVAWMGYKPSKASRISPIPEGNRFQAKEQEAGVPPLASQLGILHTNPHPKENITSLPGEDVSGRATLGDDGPEGIARASRSSARIRGRRKDQECGDRFLALQLGIMHKNPVHNQIISSLPYYQTEPEQATSGVQATGGGEYQVSPAAQVAGRCKELKDGDPVSSLDSSGDVACRKS